MNDIFYTFSNLEIIKNYVTSEKSLEFLQEYNNLKHYNVSMNNILH